MSSVHSRFREPIRPALGPPGAGRACPVTRAPNCPRGAPVIAAPACAHGWPTVSVAVVEVAACNVSTKQPSTEPESSSDCCDSEITATACASRCRTHGRSSPAF